MKAPDKRQKQTSRSKFLSIIIAWILVGVVFILASITLDLSSTIAENTSKKGAPTQANQEVPHFLPRLLEAAGIAALIFGMFNLFIELPGLRTYFLERMKELVTEKAYLKSLSKEELKNLQISVIQAIFGNDEVAEKGNFLEFLDRNIYTYIDEPYRERVILEIRYEKKDENVFIAHDRLSYTCRMSDGEIVPAILWQNDPGEIEDIRELKITVRYPPGPSQQEHQDEKRREYIVGESKGSDFYIYAIDGTPHSTSKVEDFKGKELRIERGTCYHNVDHLKVIIDAVYEVRASQILYWSMLYPTKDFSLILRFPDSHVVQAATFIHNQHVGQVMEDTGYYSFSYDSWMIPQSGVAWRLIPAKDAAGTDQEGQSI